MGGFGPRIPPLPGQPAPSYGPRYGAPYQPEGTVGFKTPMANQFVEGVNNFIGSFQGSQEAEKTKARQEFFEGVQMMQMGFKVDMKKLARAARKGELPFDFGGESQPQQPQQQAPMPGGGQQAPPMMGMGPGMQPPTGIMPQGGGGMPQGGGAPMPGGGGGRGFFGRLGAAISDPFRATGERNAPIPGNAGVYEALGQMQSQVQGQQQQQMLQAQIVQALLTKPTDSKEFVEAAIRGETMGLTKGLPEFLQDEIAVQRLADKIPGMTVGKLRERAFAAETIKMIGPLAGKVSADAMQGILQSVSGGKDLKPEWFAGEAESMVDPKESRKHWRSMYPSAPPQIWSALAALESADQWDGVDKLLEKLGPSIVEKEQGRAESTEKRAEKAEARAERGEGRAARAETRAEGKEAERIDYTGKERMASYYWAMARDRIKRGDSKEEPLIEAISLLNKDSGSRQLDKLDVLDVEAILQRKSRGGGIEIELTTPQPPGSGGDQSFSFGGR